MHILLEQGRASERKEDGNSFCVLGFGAPKNCSSHEGDRKGEIKQKRKKLGLEIEFKGNERERRPSFHLELALYVTYVQRFFFETIPSPRE